LRDLVGSRSQEPQPVYMQPEIIHAENVEPPMAPNK
jgi:hypothetical protein